MGNPRPWCFILGASSGMGEACARQLHAEGMNVYGLHLDPSSAQPHLDQLVADLSGDGTRFRLVNANAAKSSVRESVIGELKELAQGGPGVAVAVAKAALEAYVRQLAFELARSGVAVNAIRAGVTLTPALRKIPGHERIVQRAQEINPHGRLTTPEDVAQAIALMCRAPSTWITGNVIGVDGGEYFSS